MRSAARAITMGDLIVKMDSNSNQSKFKKQH